MVGEISPDGQFMWDGTAWVANPAQMQAAAMAVQPLESQPIIQQPVMGDVATDGMQGMESMSGGISGGPLAATWSPDAAGIGGGRSKGKLIVVGLIGSLLLAGVGYGTYELVIDPWLDPDPFSKDQFVQHTLATPTKEDVLSGAVDGWSCSVEMDLSVDDPELEMHFDIDMTTVLYASPDAARADLDITIRSEGFPIPMDLDIWLSREEVAWQTLEETQVVEFAAMDGNPAELLFLDEDAMYADTIDYCFLHRDVAQQVNDGTDFGFFSEAERFPNDDGERAVKVSIDYQFDGDDLAISFFFAEDNHLLGARVSNGSDMKMTIKFSDDDVSKPSWVGKADAGAWPLDLEDDFWTNYTHGTYTVATQFNSSFDMTGARLVLYSEEYDSQEEEDVLAVVASVDIQSALSSSGASIQVSDDYGTADCTFTYTDNAPTGKVSSGDVVNMSCPGEARFYDLNLGIQSKEGIIAQPLNMELPWTSPVFTILALLGALFVIHRRKHFCANA